MVPRAYLETEGGKDVGVRESQSQRDVHLQVPHSLNRAKCSGSRGGKEAGPGERAVGGSEQEIRKVSTKIRPNHPR